MINYISSVSNSKLRIHTKGTFVACEMVIHQFMFAFPQKFLKFTLMSDWASTADPFH